MSTRRIRRRLSMVTHSIGIGIVRSSRAGADRRHRRDAVRAGAEGGVARCLANRRGCRAGCARSHVQARRDTRHLPRPALQPRRSAHRTAAAAAGRPGERVRRPAARGVGTLRRRGGHFRDEWRQQDHDARDGREESCGDDAGRVERLHLPPRGRPVDADAGAHARRPSPDPVTIKLARVE